MANKVASWVDPTANTDGSAVTPGEITGYTIKIGVASGVYTTSIAVADPAATSDSLGVLAPGTYFAVVQAESTGGTSGPSNEATFTVVAPVPNPPTGFTVA